MSETLAATMAIIAIVILCYVAVINRINLLEERLFSELRKAATNGKRRNE